MTDTKPEALRLAGEFENGFCDTWLLKGGAAELRRLHEVNAELLEALKQLCDAQENGHVAYWSSLWDDARAAIAKAEGTR